MAKICHIVNVKTSAIIENLSITISLVLQPIPPCVGGVKLEDLTQIVFWLWRSTFTSL